MAGEPNRLHQPLVYGAEAQLPEQARLLFDGSRPLPPDVALIATTPALGSIPAYLALAVAIALAVPTFLTLVGDFQANAAGSIKKGNLQVDLIVCCIALLAAAVMFYAGMRRLGTVRSMRAGTWRRGLFLLPNALLLRSDEVCTWLPRASVLKIDTTRVHLNQVPYIHPAIHYRLEEGEAVFPVSEVYALSSDEIQQVLERWFANRAEAPWPKGLVKSTRA